MLVKKAADIRSSEITDKKLYLRRREFIQAAAVSAVGAAAGSFGLGFAEAATWPRIKIPNVQKASSPNLTTTEKPNAYQDIATYNNFYEFGTDKSDPSQNAGGLKTKPWTVKVDGMVSKPATITSRI
jgi:sulfoxide reductase catalytic subunit YedY